jgi:glycosyltransferase involved in cell wall biosynthesis
MCAGRPLLLAVPCENLASKIVVQSGAGLSVEPADLAAFCAAAQRLADSLQFRQDCGAAARRYAEANFDIAKITDRFEAILRAK